MEKRKQHKYESRDPEVNMMKIKIKIFEITEVPYL
jgi:hypothetical protein